MSSLQVDLSVSSAGLLWVHISILHEHIQSIHSFDRADLIKCASTLTQILEIEEFRRCQGAIVSLIGKVVSIHCLTPSELILIRPTPTILHEEVSKSKADLLKAIFRCIFSNSLSVEVAKAVLLNVCSMSAWEKLTVDKEDGIFQDILLCYRTKCTQLVAPPPRLLGFSNRAEDTIFTSSYWSTSTNSCYAEWVCRIARGIVLECYGHLLIEFRASYPSSLKSGSSIRGDDPLFAPLADLCTVNASLAETTFILAVQNIIEFNGKGSEAHNALSNLVNEHLLNPDSLMRDALRLGCRLLVCLFRRDVSSKKMTRAKGKDSKKKLIFDCVLNVDLRKAVLVAKRCGLPSTALLFYQIWMQSNAPSLDDNSLLFEIFRDLIDADELSGVSSSANLEQEAMLYLQSGNWMEAFMAFDCVLQENLATNQNRRILAEYGLVKSLQSLRADHTIQSLSFLGEESLTALSHWSLQDPDRVGADFMGHRIPLEFGAQISSIIAELSNGSTNLARQRISESTSLIIPDLLKGIAEESSGLIITTFEACKMLDDFHIICQSLESKTPQMAENLTRQWLPESLCSPIISNRCLLCAAMLRSKMITEIHAIDFLETLSSCMVSKADAFTMNSILLNFRKVLSRENIPASEEGADRLTIKWHILEANIQWKKSLVSSAMDLIESNVIRPLAPLCVDEKMTLFHDLLSEGYRLMGTWASASRRLSEREILCGYLEPAVTVAKNTKQLIKAHLALGDFYAKLHQSILTRKRSQEWRDWERISSER